MPSENLQIFSPQNFSEYVGQISAKKIAEVMVNAAKIEGRSLPNIIIDGSYGLGKTSLARVIANEAGTKATIYDAQAFNRPTLPIFGKSSIIIDEIHNLDPQIADSLNVLIDQGKLKVIGCTTNPGLLPAPFRSRFRSIHLSPYKLSEINQIIDLAAMRKGVVAPLAIRQEISKRSRFNPRVALNNLSFVLDMMTVKGQMTPNKNTVLEAFDTLGIDKNGYDQRDYAYMNAFPGDGRPVGLNALVARTGIDAKTIELEIEPYLLQTGKIDRMPKGRIKVASL